MIKLTTKQLDELIVWEYFIPKNVNWDEKTDQDIINLVLITETIDHILTLSEKVNVGLEYIGKCTKMGC